MGVLTPAAIVSKINLHEISDLCVKIGGHVFMMYGCLSD